MKHYPLRVVAFMATTLGINASAYYAGRDPGISPLPTAANWTCMFLLGYFFSPRPGNRRDERDQP